MQTDQIYAPYLDSQIEIRKAYPKSISLKAKQILLKAWDKMKLLEPIGDDDLRTIWMEVPRGKIEDFGNYKEFKAEGMVNNKKQFHELWLTYYPVPSKWYKFSIAQYREEVFIYLNSTLCFHLCSENVDDRFDETIIEWLYDKVVSVVDTIARDEKAYNTYLNQNLPYEKRLGKILRSDFWEIWKENDLGPNSNFSDSDLEIVGKIVDRSQNNDQLLIEKLNAHDFFRFCEMGYLANGLFGDASGLTPREKYLRMADGRHCGLTEIDETSYNSFKEWYLNKSHCGGHPWEIFRGGNSTHISLFVESYQNVWRLRLAGYSSSRVVETVKMAIELYKNNIPFYLEKAHEVFNMIRGLDYIGIVPDDVFPRYCHSLFPPEDKIIDFMNLGYEMKEEIITKTNWYPLNEIHLK